MGIVGELFESDWIDISTSFVVRKVEFDKVGLLEWFSVGRIGIVVEQPSYYVFVVEDLSLGSTDWRGEGL